jgi:hypothetical protein
VCGTPLTPFCYFLLSSTPTIDTEPKRCPSMLTDIFSACQRSLANMRAIWYNRGKREQAGEEEWNSGSRITGETW